MYTAVYMKRQCTWSCTRSCTVVYTTVYTRVHHRVHGRVHHRVHAYHVPCTQPCTRASVYTGTGRVHGPPCTRPCTATAVCGPCTRPLTSRVHDRVHVYHLPCTWARAVYTAVYTTVHGCVHLTCTLMGWRLAPDGWASCPTRGVKRPLSVN